MTKAAEETTVPREAIGISASAAERIAALAEMESNPGVMLRITVSGGGCAGFQYSFELSTETNDDDKIFESKGAKTVVDEASLGLIGGSELDYATDLSGSRFTLRNPNTSSTCGCGTSFSP